MKGLAGLAIVAALAFAPAAHADIKALEEAAKKEGELTWYTVPQTSEVAEKVGRTFSARYPGVKVNVVRTTA
jgi:iron(III) transport system substrate-binding protein